MQSLLIICGPTATGKTKLALDLAKHFNGEVISADSRQVFRGMDIGTGKSITDKFKILSSETELFGNHIPFYLIDNVKIWGYDLVNPDQDFSLAHFQKFTAHLIPRLRSQHRLPIITGGTGLYLKTFSHSLETTHIPPNPSLRLQLDSLTVFQLQQRLKRLNPAKHKAMNQSDRNNPRRLIRALEIETYLQAPSQLSENASRNSKSLSSPPPIDPAKSNTHSTPVGESEVSQLWIGLNAPLKLLEQRVAKNVEIRSKFLTDEIEILTAAYPNLWSFPSVSATGYHQWHSYLAGEVSRREALNRWIKAETQYARRQLTWFRQQPQIHWFDISSPNWHQQVEARVKAWYSNTTPLNIPNVDEHQD